MKNMKNIEEEMYEAEAKAWEALSRYKFLMFGYWAAIWVHLNKMSLCSRPNPWKKLVGMAKKERGSEKFVKRFPHLFSDLPPEPAKPESATVLNNE